MPSDTSSTKLPPPPSFGSVSERQSRPAPPALGKDKDKANAKAVGIDTSFIDGLTAGLVDEAPAVPEPPVLTPAAPSPAPTPSGGSDELEDLATRAFDAMKPEENEAAGEIDDPNFLAFDADALAKTADPPVAVTPGGTQLALEAQPPAPLAPSSDAPSPSVTHEHAPAHSSEGSPASPIPRSWLMVGAASGLVVLALIWKTCGGTATDTTAQHDERVAALEQGGEPDEGFEDGAAQGGSHGGGAGEDEGGAGGGAGEGAGASDNDEDDGAPAGAGEADEDREAGAGDDDGSPAAGSDARNDGLDDDDDEIEPSSASGSEATADEQTKGTQSGKGSPQPLPANTQPTERSAEDGMTAEELLEAAKKAYAKGKSRDAYRLANLSHQKSKSDEALEIKAKAACRMKNKDLAKSAYKSLPMGEKRREIRQTCRENDIRLGL